MKVVENFKYVLAFLFCFYYELLVKTTYLRKRNFKFTSFRCIILFNVTNIVHMYV